MAIAEDLLEQARHLAVRERRKPKQASLRRSMSASYFALFHLLTRDSSCSVVAASLPRELRHLVARAHSHTEMKRVARQWTAGAGSLPQELRACVDSVPAEIVEVAKVFVRLQEARHRADYDLGAPLGRKEVLEVVRQTEEVFRKWAKVRKQSVAVVFLISLLLGKRLRGGE